MNLLTDEEIKAIYAKSKAEFLRQVKDGGAGKWEPLTSARAIEAAVLEKVAKVDVEPVGYWAGNPQKAIALAVIQGAKK